MKKISVSGIVIGKKQKVSIRDDTKTGSLRRCNVANVTVARITQMEDREREREREKRNSEKREGVNVAKCDTHVVRTYVRTHTHTPHVYVHVRT